MRFLPLQQFATNQPSHGQTKLDLRLRSLWLVTKTLQHIEKDDVQKDFDASAVVVFPLTLMSLESALQNSKRLVLEAQR